MCTQDEKMNVKQGVHTLSQAAVAEGHILRATNTVENRSDCWRQGISSGSLRRNLKQVLQRAL